MRKLSKKISMLMVLAMLVSLFSGVVSASAASVWSFYNKTADDSIVAYADETYPMENDQFADFDLYKSGEVVDTDVYTVVYESSDEDVVWVNAKNGKLRAQKDAEIGATAEITAHITNKVNGKKADRSFTIEIVAAEVEEPTPTEAPEVVTATEIVDVKQKADKIAEITFDADITEEEAKTIQLFLGKVNKSGYLKSVKVEGNVVTFESFATFGNGKTWSFVYGESTKEMKSSQGEVAKVEITGPEDVYLKADGVTLDGTEITFVCYDALDVKVNMPTDGSAYIDWHLDPEDVADITTITKDGKDVYAVLFKEADKQVALSGTYHTGKTNEETWEEITFEIDPIIVTSFDNNDPVMVGLGKVGVADKNTDATSDDAYKTLTVPADTDNYKLFVKFLFDDKDKTQKLPTELGENKDGLDKDGKQIVTYESAEPDKLIVDPKTGEIIPVGEGDFKVIVNVNGEWYDDVLVHVGPAVASVDPTIENTANWISNSTELNQSITYTAKGNDNYGVECKDDRAYKINNVEVKTSPYNPNKEEEKAIKESLVGSFITFAGDSKVTVNAVNDGATLKVGNYKLELTVKGFDGKETKKLVSFVVKGAKADDEIKSYAVEWVGGNGSYNTAVNKDTANFDGTVSFKIVGKNAAGVPVKYENVEAVSGSIAIKLGTKAIEGLVFSGDTVSMNLYKAADGAYSVTGSAATYTGIDNGTYVITGKIGNVSIPNTTFTVDNNQAKPAITVDSKALTITSGADVEAAIVACLKAPEAKDGYTFSEITLVDPKITDGLAAGNVGEYTVYVKSVKITQIFSDKVTFTYTVDIKTAFNVTVTE